MQSCEIGVTFLDDEGAEGEAEGYVVESEGFRVRGRGEDGGWDGELEGWGHSCEQSLSDFELL